ncbi:MAG: YbaK/EbsC family protein [Chloroflexi bacterium]|nr:YbaK/EbsC family protein [Chloroflexota bacterium]
MELLNLIQQFDPNASYHAFEKSTHSVGEAATAIGEPPERFVKNICMMTERGLVVGIVKGENRASLKRVAQALDVELPRLAYADEIVELTGYEYGGTPSWGFEAIFLVDPRVMDEPYVVTGGGKATSLIKTTPDAILQANQGTVVRIRK